MSFENKKYVRDRNSNAIINKDKSELDLYRSKKKRAEEINNMRGDIDSLKNDVQEIKSLLKNLVGK